MRGTIGLIAAAVLLGSSGGAVARLNTQRVQDLLGGIFQDVATIVESFSGGPNDPRGPVSDSGTLARDKASLDAATQKANDLAAELSKVQTVPRSGK